jgi:hypothetical protein
MRQIGTSQTIELFILRCLRSYGRAVFDELKLTLLALSFSSFKMERRRQLKPPTRVCLPQRDKTMRRRS